jgi:V/A-type H+-transporting ATPase subunit I
MIFGLLSLYRTTGYLGDTLSYSRLLALMMTTSIIGMVVNIIAMLTKDSVPILGYVIMLLVLVLGHAFNLIVSVLGAFIHAARLQLVEFFGKFYEGGGREFRPLRRETKYILIK